MRLLCKQLKRIPPKVYFVYVSFPYSEDPKKTTDEVNAWVQKVWYKCDDLFFLVPHDVVDQIWELPPGYSHPEVAFKELALIYYKIDIVTYSPNRKSVGVNWEISFARLHGIPVITMEDLEKGVRP